MFLLTRAAGFLTGNLASYAVLIGGFLFAGWLLWHGGANHGKAKEYAIWLKVMKQEQAVNAAINQTIEVESIARDLPGRMRAVEVCITQAKSSAKECLQ